MRIKFFPLLLMAVVCTLPKSARSQQDEQDRKVSIEVTTTENGKTITRNIDLENATEAELQEALRDLGIMDHFTMSGDDENVIINIQRYGNGDDSVKDMQLRITPPVTPIPPQPPMVQGDLVKHTWLGVSNQKLSEATITSQDLPIKVGVEVLEVIEGSPALAAGLQKGDVISAIDGRTIEGPGMLSEVIRGYKVGDKVKVTYYRNGKKKTVPVVLAERVSQDHSFHYGRHGNGPMHFDREWKDQMKGPRAFLGITPGEPTEGISGAVIAEVEEGSAAERMGLQPGDVIQIINGDAVDGFGALSRKIRTMAPGDQVTLQVDRAGSILELQGELGEKEGGFTWTSPEDGSFNFNFEGFNEQDREAFRKEMDQLRQEMEQLRQNLGRELRSETRITIESRKLTDEEKDMLRDKGVTGLDNELELSDLQTFPNPSDGFFRIHFDVPERGDLEVDVHDAAGERVYQERITGFKGRYERTLDLSDKASGTYYLVVRQDGRATSRKLVKL